MKKKIVGIFVCMLLIVAAVLPVAGTVSISNTMNEENSVLEDVEQGLVTGQNIGRGPDYDWGTSGQNVYTGTGGSYPSGNVGIGTTSPIAKLHVNNGAVLFNGTTGGTPTSGGGTRLMWIPAKSAFRAGYVWSSEWDDSNIGDYSVAMGYGTTASEYSSTAMGQYTTASGGQSTAMGFETIASHGASTAMGAYTTASGLYSTAMGYDTIASGDWGSIAMGCSTIASGTWASTAMGSDTNASGYTSTAMGKGTTASGRGSTAMGIDTIASEEASSAMGYGTTASGYYSTAMGYYNYATGGYSTAMGRLTYASGDCSTAMGADTIASGYISTAMGDLSIASGDCSTAMGYHTTASGWTSTAMGRKITVEGDYSVGIGLDDTDYIVSDDSVLSIMGGDVGIGTTNPLYLFHVLGGSGIVAEFSGRVKGAQAVNDDEFVTKAQVKSVVTSHYTPTGTSDTTGELGDTAWDNDYFYVKTPNGWKRAPLETWETPEIVTK